MSVSYPTVGGTIAQSALGSGYYYKHVATDTSNNIARWELWDAGGARDNSHGFSIRWNSTTSKNEINVNDQTNPYYNDGNPLTLSINAGSLLQTTNTSLWHEIQNNDLIQFFSTSSGTSYGDGWTVVTADHLWSTSSGGGGFLGGGVSGASGSITHFGSSITWSIDQNSPTADGASNFYYLKRDNIIYYSYGITHQNGYDSTYTIPTQVGVWKLWHEDQNGFHLLAEVTVTSVPDSGKAFCNFW